MLFFKLLEIAVISIVLIFGITQIIIPAYKKRILFPLFRRQGKLEKQEVELNQLKVERELKYKLDREKGDKNVI